MIAEGVETEGQREFLESEGCHVYQGFLFSPALKAAQFEDFVVARPLLEKRSLQMTARAASVL